MMHHRFDEEHLLHELKHYLPTQTPIRDFIHHNSLHAFQQMKFYDGIRKAAAIFGFQVTLRLDEYRTLYRNGRIREDVLDSVILRRKEKQALLEWKKNALEKEYDARVFPRIGRLRQEWKNSLGYDLDYDVHPVLFRILCAYLDQGISLLRFPAGNSGLLEGLRVLETQGMSSFFRTSAARRLLLDPATRLRSLLDKIIGDETWFEQYVFDQQFAHRGWSGMVATVEDRPESLLDRKKISLRELLVLDLLLEYDSIVYRKGNDWKPLASSVKGRPENLFADVPATEVSDVFEIWQDAFEWSYYDEVLNGLRNGRQQASREKAANRPSFQAIFCIDERECSLRRHLEQTDPGCETLGSPGFFGVEFYFLQEHTRFYEKLCPAPVTPAYLIKEKGAAHGDHHELLYARKAQTLLGGIPASLGLGLAAAAKLLLNQFRPRMSPAISNAFGHMDADSELLIENQDPAHRENGLQVGFTVQEMAARVENLLRSIGLVKNFAPIVYAVAHGSSSANNPHHGAHDCGACSGRPGATNARVFAWMANHSGVREILKERGLVIPDDTQFVGSMHDTAADRIGFYDLKILHTENAAAHRKHYEVFEEALDRNAQERSRRFASIDTRRDKKQVRKAILDRSVSMFEPRPELGHGTNSLCIVGRRGFTKNIFLDRRAFLNSYDYSTDPEGKLLAGVMRPLGPVCGGINLEYYFSRVDNYKLGAGTKLPHNVMGLIGVANSCDGDLRPGLPLQMIEVHDPVRLLLIVEHFPEVILDTIRSEPPMYEWFINEWVHLVALHPETGRFHYFRDGNFGEYQPSGTETRSVRDFSSLFENSLKMETNQTADATQENLPVYLIDRS